MGVLLIEMNLESEVGEERNREIVSFPVVRARFETNSQSAPFPFSPVFVPLSLQEESEKERKRERERERKREGEK